MTMIKKYIEDENGNQVLPITHFSAVKDSDGNSLEDILWEESAYDPTTYSGMGRKVLQKNMVSGVNTLTQDMMPVATGGNTIYIIRYDFTLGENITIPANCVLEFDGGSISGAYTLTGSNTGLKASLVKIFNTDVILSGNFKCVPYWYVEWFGASYSLADNSVSINNAITKLEALGSPVILKLENCYTITDTIYLYRYVSLYGSDLYTRMVYSLDGKGTIKTNFSTPNKWAIDTINYENNNIPPYDKLNTNNTDYPGNQTCHNIKNLHFHTVDNTYAYGAIRTYGMYGGFIKNIDIANKYYIGIAITHFSWSLDFSNIINHANTIGFYIGKSVTSLQMNNISAESYTQGSDALSTLPVIDSESMPSYCSPKCVGYVFEKCNVTMVSCDAQGYDMAIIGNSYAASVYNLYLENIPMGIAYLGVNQNSSSYLHRLYMDSPKFQLVADMTSYQFGVATGSRGTIEAIGYNYSRCWDNGNEAINYIIRGIPTMYRLNIYDDTANSTICKQKVIDLPKDERGRTIYKAGTMALIVNERSEIFKFNAKLNWVANPEQTNYNFGSNGYLIEGGDIKLTSNINLRCDTPISIANTRLELDTKANNFGWHSSNGVDIYNGNSQIIIDKPIIMSDLTSSRFWLKGEGIINLQIEMPNNDLTLAKATLLTDVTDFTGIYTITVKYNNGVYIIQGDTRNV